MTVVTRKKKTLVDVAEDAGVSTCTASAVLNGSRSNTRVSPETRDRILASAARLNYLPNARARSLARRRSNTIGVAFHVVEAAQAIGHPYAAGILQGIVTEAQAQRYHVLFYTEHWQDARHSLANFGDQSSDGAVVVAPPLGSDILTALSDAGMSVCAISADPADSVGGISRIDVDNAAGIRIAVRHLLELGHRRIAHLTGDADLYSSGLRREAFLTAMAEADIPVPPEYIVGCTYDARTVPEILPGLLSLPKPPTAIAAGNDFIAFAVLEEAHRLGIAVPQTLSVIGFDDHPGAAIVTPKLTTIRQPIQEIGARAARRLIEQIRGEGAATEELLPPTLIVRQSTAPPAI